MAGKGIEIDLPCGGNFRIENIVVDLNGTLALDGDVPEDVRERLSQLAEHMNVYVLTADTHQSADALLAGKTSPVRLEKLGPGCGDIQKLEFITRLGRGKTAAIGNGKNDVLMLKEAAIGVCVIGREGASSEALRNSEIVVHDVRDALDLFLKPNRFIATLRE